MDVRRDCVRFARVLKRIATGYADPSHSKAKNSDQLRRSLLQSLQPPHLLPDFYAFFWRQVKCIGFNDIKYFVELRYVSDCAVNAVLSR